MLKLNRVPRRLTVRAIPNDNASSLPLNQRARIALWATTSGSAPAPKTKRPTMSIGTVCAAATMTAPASTRTEKIRLESRVPSRSIRNPPIRRAMIAATLYMV